MLDTTYNNNLAQQDVENATYAKVTWRLIPFLLECQDGSGSSCWKRFHLS